MASRGSIEKPIGDVDFVENIPQANILHFYAPRTAEEKKLDRSINLKLDFIILPLLALNFMVCASLACLQKFQLTTS